MPDIIKYDIKDLQETVLTPYQKHRQLSMKEAQSITLDILSILCDGQVKDEDTLKWLARFMTSDTYSDLMDERNLNKLCGYPMCHASPERERDPFEMSKLTKQFLWENNPYAYLSRFCSKYHFRCSQFYQVQLSDDALFSRTGIHLINNSMPTNIIMNEKYNVELMEAMLRNKATEDEFKNIILGVKKLEIDGPDKVTNDTNTNPTPEDLTKWFEDFKIIENEKPTIIDDYLKDHR
ncbi:RNA polymerase II subunit B1 CTD phosphatase RTR1 PWA37_002039 [Arxiozyma heterogenica]|uniref:RNA polymerase II subunit B1 CTD phosphatase RPAP2 homolog n=1 Tax=Arxiozyma heterogenica TaxID=278026 RepID=A0AAN8A7M5_9SACH|nr:hypothetical protein RI543_001503 [Kazachstania heterogenica]